MEKTTYIRSGALVSIDTGNIQVYDTLQPAIYNLVNIPFQGYKLQVAPSFEALPRMYGNPTKYMSRILKAFYERKGKTTGVLLSGEKGSGKTMLQMALSLELIKENIPTIIISGTETGPEFVKFMSQIRCPAVIVFDEFDKNYDRDDQEEILGLLSGMQESHKLYLFSANTLDKLSPYMINRPGRIFYHIRYSGVDSEIVQEFCEDRLANKSHIADVVKVAKRIHGFNFDMLSSIVEEMNRFNFDIKEAVSLMNIEPVSTADTYRPRLVLPSGLEIEAMSTFHVEPDYFEDLGYECWRFVLDPELFITNKEEMFKMLAALGSPKNYHVYEDKSDLAVRVLSPVTYIDKEGVEQTDKIHSNTGWFEILEKGGTIKELADDRYAHYYVQIPGKGEEAKEIEEGVYITDYDGFSVKFKREAPVQRRGLWD